MFETKCQLPEDMQRELNQNLAEQARIEAMRARHQQQMAAARARASGAGPQLQQAQPTQKQPKQPFDPNNYSFQQVSPPIQYSYYQPYGDAAQPQQAAAGAAGQQQQQQQQPINIDLNNLNFDIPAPQARVSSAPAQAPQLVPSFTGVGGLPVMQAPVAASNEQQSLDPNQQVPVGQAPLAPQAQQRGPPLTEADFRDITGGENYGAPAGGDFGLAANPAGGGQSSAGQPDGTDAQLREFGMPEEKPRGAGRPAARRQDDLTNGFGNFGGLGGGGGAPVAGAQRGAPNPFEADFLGGVDMPAMMGGGRGGRQSSAARRAPSNDFDFASQPSSDQASAPSAASSGAPGSLQALLGGGFPGLGGGRDSGTMGLEDLARGVGGGAGGEQGLRGAAGQQQRPDDGALDLADLGGTGGTDSRADAFPGLDGGIGQQQSGGDDDAGQQQQEPDASEFGLAAAAAAPQPKSVPYPDGGPQFVGTLWALGQPQSLTQARYNAMPDKGTYQDYPAYQSGGNDFSAVQSVVERTPRARPTGPGRYANPSPSELAPEHRGSSAAFDYSKSPLQLKSTGEQFEMRRK